jgi:hypothetical protein
VFVKVFSLSRCYGADAFVARDCDFLLRGTFFVIFGLNAILVYATFRKEHMREALPRAFAIAFGFPMLFALDRGNLVLPCFTCFCLAFGKLLGSKASRIAMLAAAIHFKPYLLLCAFPGIIQRKFKWLVQLALWGAAIYLVTYLLQGGGSPFELLRNARIWSSEQGENFWERSYYSTSFAPLLRFASSDFPLLQYINSKTLDFLVIVLSLLMRLGALGAVVVYALSAVRPKRLDARSLTAMTLALLLMMSESGGGYALVFLLFFVFLEPWKGPVHAVMLVCAYLLCMPVDHIVMPILQQQVDSYWAGRSVYAEFGVSLAQFVRPALVLCILYCQILLNLRVLSPKTERGETTRREEKGEAWA